eukprot:TRINITY_DN21624_c0_g1_i1.p1 TRINITY_DN21624_c0_g1~~TRINITY_DN21624_c0_g1_i1.p1  ORF type:complete len:980 (+),score=201.44 TRINITY_DN21624_c0_g1_i1:59-2998(+)
MNGEVSICEEGGSGLVFPLGDHHWPAWLRTFLYAFALGYCFLGVAIVADCFMSAIEAITSRRRQVLTPDGRKVTTFVWNETVANLSLMALGSSAPEIFLSVIDLFRKKMHVSVLGSATIVGSGAFNLLVIVALCIVTIPAGESRKVEQFQVFLVTAMFSLLAYLWVAFILIVSSPDVVQIWEAAVTFVFLFILIWVSYKTDIGDFDFSRLCGSSGAGEPKEEPAETVVDDGDPGTTALESEMQSEMSMGSIGIEGERNTVHVMGEAFSEARLSDKFQESIKIDLTEPKKSPRLSGTSRASPASRDSERSKSQEQSRPPKTWMTLGSTSHSSMSDFAVKVKRRKSIASHHMKAMSHVNKGGAKSLLKSSSKVWNSEESKPSFAKSSSCVFEGQDWTNGERVSCEVHLLTDVQIAGNKSGRKVIKLMRDGDLRPELLVDYTVDLLLQRPMLLKPTCNAPQMVAPYQKREDADPKDWREEYATKEVYTGVLKLEQNEKESVITLEYADIAGLPEQGDLLVTLTDVRCDSKYVSAEVGAVCSTCIRREIQVPQQRISFGLEAVSLDPCFEPCTVDVIVHRLGNCKEVVSVKYSTEALDAVPGMDYESVEGTLTFLEGETEQRIPLEVLPTAPFRPAHTLLVVLNPADDADDNVDLFDLTEDGGSESAILTIRLEAVEENSASFWRKLNTCVNVQSVQAGNADWISQIRSSCLVNGSWEEQAEAQPLDWIWHIFCLPWSVLFSFIPPTTYFGGWFCFVVNLSFIAALTGVIADLAELFGCMITLPDIVTAITFVALGTSMPDLFASKMAAIEDPTADASIVNVTGSNSVNVFLGLGLPWSIGAIYWAVTPRTAEWENTYSDIAARVPEGMVFVVYSGDLGLCTMVFCVTALMALFVLILRRMKVGAELGGPPRLKWLSGVSLVVFWLAYVALASWRALRKAVSPQEEFAVIGGISILCAVVFVANVAAYLMTPPTDETGDGKRG